MKLFDRFRCGSFYGIRHRQHARRLAVYRCEHGALPFRLQLSRMRLHVLQPRHAPLLKERGFANRYPASTDFTDHATPREGFEIHHGLQLQSALLRATDNGRGKRMFAVLLNRRGGKQYFALVKAASSDHPLENRPALGKGAGFVDDKRVHLLHNLNGLGVSY